MTDRDELLMSLNRLMLVIRAYDIRGTIPNDFDEKDVLVLGRALGRYLKQSKDDFTVLCGMDNRTSSFGIMNALCAGFAEYGISVKNLGVMPTPSLYYHSFVSNFYKKTLGIMITASHNPPEYNGFKILFDSKIVDGNGLRAIINGYKEDLLNVVQITQDNDYIQYILNETKLNQIKNSKAKKILWDCNNGAVGSIIHEMIKNLPTENYIINCGKKMVFQPDPTNIAHINRIKNLASNYDLALCFDGDGDRLVVITKNGQVLRGDKILLILAKYFAKTMSGRTIVVDIKTSNLIISELEKIGFKVIIHKTGHSFIKQMMLETNALLGGEVSGHLFFQFSNSANLYIPYDDAMLAACYVIKFLLEDEDFFLTTVNKMPKSFSRYDIKIKCEKDLQNKVTEEFAQVLKAHNATYIDIDGIKHQSEDGWWLVRPSNTEDMLIICIESSTVDGYMRNANFIKNILQKMNLQIDDEEIDYT
jgi:phosphomannomutase